MLSFGHCTRSLVAFALLASVAVAQLVPTVNDIPFAQVGTKSLVLDLYLPTTGKAPYPVVVHIHGGGWAGGTHDVIPGGSMGALLQQGFAIASPQYRLTTEAGLYGPGVPVIFPAQINDVKGAIRWLRAHAAQYNLDGARIGVWGESAGGHLSALLATSGSAAAIEGTVGGNLAFSSRVQAAVDYFGPTDLLHMNDDVTTPPGSTLDHDAFGSPESKLIGWSLPGQGLGDIKLNLANPNPPYPQLLQLLAQADPITWVDAADPAMFIAHGTVDTTVPMAQSTKLAEALSGAGVANTYIQAAGFGHGFLGVTVDQQAVAFLVSRLSDASKFYLPTLSTTQPVVPIGNTLTLQIKTTFSGDAWVLFYGSIGAPLPVPPFGTYWLDPLFPAVAVALGSLPPGATSQSVPVNVPPDPTLHGLQAYLQLLAGGGTGGTTSFFLSNVLKVSIP